MLIVTSIFLLSIIKNVLPEEGLGIFDHLEPSFLDFQDYKGVDLLIEFKSKN